MIAFSKQRRREEEGGVLAGVAGGSPSPFVKIRVHSWLNLKSRLEPGHGEFLNHEFSRINTNGEGAVVWMIKGEAGDCLSNPWRPWREPISGRGIASRQGQRHEG